MERLLLNRGRYAGESIDIHQTLSQIEEAALKHGWKSTPIKVSETNSLPAYSRGERGPQIYISSGIHGDEPAGPLAVLRLLQEHQWPADEVLWLVPCLNREGFVRNCRDNGFGIDLNRDYRDPKTDVVRAHIAWLEERPRFDLTLLLHEDWEANGFYLYELNPDSGISLGPAMIEAVKKVCPVDTSPTIEGRPAKNGVISANPYLIIERPDWPEAFYLIRHKSPRSYTLEAPSDYPLAVRVDALVAGVHAALQARTDK